MKLENGILWIDGRGTRVQPLIRPFMVVSKEADYYENIILAMAEDY